MNYDTALQFANEIVTLLRPFTTRIEIAGGVRRKKKDPHDIEIVCIPKMSNAELLTSTLDGIPITSPPLNNLHMFLETSTSNRIVFEHGEPDKGKKKAPFGEKYYRLKYKGEKLDIFAVLPPADFSVIYTIRTGNADFSKWLVSQGFSRGLRVKDGHLERNGEVLTMSGEEMFLRLMIFDYPKPEDRNLNYCTTHEAAIKANMERLRKMM